MQTTPTRRMPSKVSGLKPVWVDPDDDITDVEGIDGRRTKLEAREGSTYEQRLIQNFEMVYGPTPKWARLDNNQKKKNKKEDVEDEGDDDEGVLKDVGESKRLMSLGRLDVLRVENLNSKRDEGAIIRSVGFHPKSAVGLVAGNGVVSLYQVNGTSNPLIQSVAFEDFPIRKAQFCSRGDEIYVSSGLMNHFYSYDMHSGKTRQVKPHHLTRHETIRNLIPSPNNDYLVAVGRETLYLLAKGSKELVHSWSVNGEVKGVAFGGNGDELLVLQGTGEIYRWNIKTRSCLEKFTGQANFDGSTLAAGPSYIATGSSTGYVSVFPNNFNSPVDKESESDVVSIAYKEPLGELKNLVTEVSSIRINHSEEILAMASVDKDNAVRLVHLPTLKTFANFPPPNALYGRCNSLAFSPNSGYFALGSNKGCAYLFRLNHFSSY